MHELGIVFYIIENIEDVQKANGLTDIASVTVSLGEVSGVIDSYLQDCFEWAVKKHKSLSHCVLHIEKIAAVTECLDCHQTYETVTHGVTCPYCKSENTVLRSGNEIIVKEIEAM